jgi:hypothetical protein
MVERARKSGLLTGKSSGKQSEVIRSAVRHHTGSLHQTGSKTVVRLKINAYNRSPAVGEEPSLHVQTEAPGGNDEIDGACDDRRAKLLQKLVQIVEQQTLGR